MSERSELKNSGLKATMPRLAVLELFRHSQQRHMSAEEVYRKLLEGDVDVGLATVYRVLTQFEQAGLLERHHFESGKAVFEIRDGDHHDHLVCLQCGFVEEFHDDLIEQRQIALARERGFEVTAHAHNLYVDCRREACPRRNTSASDSNAAAGETT